MKRRRILCLVAGLAFVVVASQVWPRGPREPVYQGKALTQWINEAVDVGIFEQTDETKAAMIAFGANAVPFLLHQFTRPVSRRRDSVIGWVNSHFFLRLQTGEGRLHKAGRGLMLLETNAAPAFPVLMRCLDDPNQLVRQAATNQLQWFARLRTN